MNDKKMVFLSFFNYPDESKMDIGGWLIRGHDKNDVYQELVINKRTLSSSDYPNDWIDWCRWPLEVGSILLKDE